MSDENIKKQKHKEKSVLYPYFNLKESIDFAKLVERIAGKGMATENSAATELGVSRNTKSFAYKVSSARQFGLITKSKEGLQVTDRTRSILHPINEADVPEVIKECFQLPPLYKKIIKRYEGLQLPGAESLSNLMYNQLGVAGKVKDRAAKVFLDNISFANALDSEERLSLVKEEKYPDEIQDDQNQFQEDLEIGAQQGKIKDFGGVKSGCKYQTLLLALSGGQNAKLYLPSDITKKDVERIKKLMDLMIVEK